MASLSPVFMCSLRYNDGMVLRRDSSGASDTDGDGSGSEVSGDSEHDEFLGEAGGGDLGATFQEVSAGGRVMVPPSSHMFSCLWQLMETNPELAAMALEQSGGDIERAIAMVFSMQ